MSVRCYWDTWCDNDECLQWCQGGTGDSKKEARDNAKRIGWLRLGAKDLCSSECLAAFRTAGSE